jgi:hypothetical protein
MIKVNTTPIRQVTAPYEYLDEATGEKQVEQIRVHYRGLTTKEGRETWAAAEAAMKAQPKKKGKAEESAEEFAIQEPSWYVDMVITRLVALPDLADESGKPFPITKESLDTLDVLNVKAIHEAIQEDLNPKAQPPK